MSGIFLVQIANVYYNSTTKQFNPFVQIIFGDTVLRTKSIQRTENEKRYTFDETFNFRRKKETHMSLVLMEEGLEEKREKETIIGYSDLGVMSFIVKQGRVHHCVPIFNRGVPMGEINLYIEFFPEERFDPRDMENKAKVRGTSIKAIESKAFKLTLRNFSLNMYLTPTQNDLSRKENFSYLKIRLGSKTFQTNIFFQNSQTPNWLDTHTFSIQNERDFTIEIYNQFLRKVEVKGSATGGGKEQDKQERLQEGEERIASCVIQLRGLQAGLGKYNGEYYIGGVVGGRVFFDYDYVVPRKLIGSLSMAKLDPPVASEALQTQESQPAESTVPAENTQPVDPQAPVQSSNANNTNAPQKTLPFVKEPVQLSNFSVMLSEMEKDQDGKPTNKPKLLQNALLRVLNSVISIDSDLGVQKDKKIDFKLDLSQFSATEQVQIELFEVADVKTKSSFKLYARTRTVIGDPAFIKAGTDQDKRIFIQTVNLTEDIISSNNASPNAGGAPAAAAASGGGGSGVGVQPPTVPPSNATGTAPQANNANAGKPGEQNSAPKKQDMGTVSFDVLYVNQFHPQDPKNPDNEKKNQMDPNRSQFKITFHNFRAFLTSDPRLDAGSSSPYYLRKPFLRIRCSNKAFDTQADDQLGKIFEWDERFNVNTAEEFGNVIFEVFHQPHGEKEKVLYAKGELPLGTEKDPMRVAKLRSIQVPLFDPSIKQEKATLFVDINILAETQLKRDASMTFTPGPRLQPVASEDEMRKWDLYAQRYELSQRNEVQSIFLPHIGMSSPPLNKDSYMYLKKTRFDLAEQEAAQNGKLTETTPATTKNQQKQANYLDYQNSPHALSQSPVKSVIYLEQYAPAQKTQINDPQTEGKAPPATSVAAASKDQSQLKPNKIQILSEDYKKSMLNFGMSNNHSAQSLRHSIPSLSFGQGDRFPDTQLEKERQKPSHFVQPLSQISMESSYIIRKPNTVNSAVGQQLQNTSLVFSKVFDKYPPN